MSITPSSPRQLLSRLGALITLILVLGLLPSVADSVASAQSDSSSESQTDGQTATESSDGVDSSESSSTTADASTNTDASATADASSSADGDATTTSSALDDTPATPTTTVEPDADGTTSTTADADTDSTATTGVESEDPTGTTSTTTESDPSGSTDDQVDDDTSTSTTVDGSGETPSGDGSETTAEGDEADVSTDEADETDVSTDEAVETGESTADESTESEVDEELDETGDGETIISEKLEPLPGFTGGGAVISSNPIRRLGGGWYEQPVMVVGRNATAEIEAAIRDAERQGSADARALIEVQTRISELSEANDIEIDESTTDVSTATDALTTDASTAPAETDRPVVTGSGDDSARDVRDSGSSVSSSSSSDDRADVIGPPVGSDTDTFELVVSPAELARQAAWETVLDDSRSRVLSGTASRSVAFAELKTKRITVDAVTLQVAASEALVDDARSEAQSRAKAERTALALVDDATASARRAEAAVASAKGTVRRYEVLVDEARDGAKKATDNYETSRLDLQAVAVAWYVGSEALAGDAGDLLEATTADNRVEIGRVEALSLLEDRRALLKTATDELTEAQALFSNRRFAVKEAREAQKTASDDAAAARSSEESAKRSATAAERSAATALIAFNDAEADLNVDRRRLAVVTRERDALVTQTETIGTEILKAREAYVTASLELGRPLSDAALAVLDAATDDHDHFSEVEGVEEAHDHDEDDPDGEHARLGDTVAGLRDPRRATATTNPGTTSASDSNDVDSNDNDSEEDRTSTSSSSSTSSTKPAPTAQELAARAAQDAAERAEEERVAAEEEQRASEAAERVARAEERRLQVESEIAALRAQAKELSDRRGLAPSALRSLLNSSSVTFPIAGEWNFIDSWGFPRSGGRRHKGSDIFAPQGTPLVAIEDGRVKSKTNRLGGNVVYLYGDSGNTYYYAHLSAFHPRARAGGRIKAGEVLGYVGTSGNARGTPPHLHIGLKGPGTSAINPYPLMRALSEAVVAEQRRGARASVSPFAMANLSADVISQLVAEGVPLLPSVVDALPPDVKADLQRRGVL